MDFCFSLPGHDLDALMQSRHGDPFSVLGPHTVNHSQIVRVFLPGASKVSIRPAGSDDKLIGMYPQGSGLFEVEFAETDYSLRIEWPGGIQETGDPYRYGTQLPDLDLYLFAEGRHFHLPTRIGANPDRGRWRKGRSLRRMGAERHGRFRGRRP